MKNKEDLMPFEKFKHIMSALIEFRDKKERISDFFEHEMMTDSYCYLTLGSDVESSLINMLADEFECWYTFNKEAPKIYDWWNKGYYYGFENDIENWMYTITEEPKTVTVNGNEIPLDSLEELYEFLVNQATGKYNLKKEENLTESKN